MSFLKKTISKNEDAADSEQLQLKKQEVNNLREELQEMQDN